MSKQFGKKFEFPHYLINMIFDTVRINVWDINYFFSNQESLKWSLLQLENSRKIIYKGFLPQFFVFFGRMGRIFLRLIFRRFSKTNIDKPIILFGLTVNQIESLRPLFSELEDNVVLIDGSIDRGWNILLLQSYIVAIAFFPIALKDLLDSSGTNKEGICHNFANHWLTYGLYFICRLTLHHLKIRGVVLSNDHIMETRIIIKASKDENILTFYIQHASVTRCFPPLIVDYALLDGLDAMEQYEEAGISKTKVYLIGSPKFDLAYEKINSHEKLNSLGICLNTIDPIESVEQFCHELRAYLPLLVVILRVHPSEVNRKPWVRLAEKYNIIYSDSQKEPVFEYLKRVDAIIAGNSNIHLEAVLLNVYSIYYDFAANKKNQYYTFLQKGLCDEVTDINSAYEIVNRLIRNKPNIRERGKKYIDTINTKYDGRSSELASGIIREAVFIGHVNVSLWQQLLGTSLTTFCLREKFQ